MTRFKWPFVFAALLMSFASPISARELARYLIMPGDIPEGCEKVAGAYPLNQKVKNFYELQVYRLAVPAPVDRHTQSFNCAGEKGSLYFLQYLTANDQEKALLFARPVLSQPAPAPQWVEWRGGFAIVSFAHPPEKLLAKLKEKAGGASAAPSVPLPAGGGSQVVQASSTVIAPSVIASSAQVTIATSVPSTFTVVALPVPSTATAVSPPAPQEPPAPLKPKVDREDISNQQLKKLRQMIECGDSSLPEGLKDVCEALEEFRKGERNEEIIFSTATRIGRAYRVDANGRLADYHYEAASSAGGKRELVLTPVRAIDGVEDIVLTEAIAARREGRPLPESESLRHAAAWKKSTPLQFRLTTGTSWVAGGDDTSALYLRQYGDAWIFLAIANTDVERSRPQGFLLIRVY